MSNANDFAIENGVLKYYKGTGTEVVIPEGVTEIEKCAFCFNRLKETITSIIIPPSVTKIGSSAFSGCTNITSITLFDGLEEICDSAFNCCRSLSSINIPASVVKIGKEAFIGCRNLTSIHIPANVVDLDGSVFSCCENLSRITTDEKNNCFSNDENGVLFNKDKTELIKFPANNSMTKYAIPDSVKAIGSYAFQNCINLAEITIPDSVVSIGDCAFDGCENINTLPIPDHVTTIGKRAFACCKNLDTIIIPDGVTQILEEAFTFCESLTTVNIPNEITRIESEAFSNCSNLKFINLPDSIKSVFSGSFYGLHPFATLSMSHKVAQALKNRCFRIVYDDSGNPYPFFLNVKLNDESTVCIFLISKDDDEKTDLFLNKSKINMRDYDKFVAQDKRYKTEYKLYAALTRLTNPYKLDKAIAKYYKELLEINLKKAVTIACDNCKSEWLKVMLEHKIINKENYKIISPVIKGACSDITDLFATTEIPD